MGMLVLKSKLLDAAGFRHAFFGRRGGTSAAPWGLNFAAASTGDDPDRVRQNIARAAEILEIDPTRLYFLSQVHGCAHHVLRGTESPEDVVRRVGDITVSRAPGVACGVRSADCVSVLLGDRRTGAVAAVHSGWRGTEARVAQAGVAALREIGGGSAELVAAIGPHIEACCFEIGPDVAERLARASTAGDRAIVPGDRPHADLRRIVRAQLVESGLDDAAIDDVHGCTFCDAESFHSYRRDGARSGRMLSAIVTRP